MKGRENNKIRYQRFLTFALISGITVFGLVSTLIVISTNVSYSQLETGAAAIAVYKAQNANHNNFTIVSGPVYSWIFRYVLGQDLAFQTRDSSIPMEAKNIILIVDITYKSVLARIQVEDEKQIENLLRMYDETQLVSTITDYGFQYDTRLYPYTNIKLCPVEENEVRINH